MAKGLVLRPGPGRAQLRWAEDATDQVNDVTAPGWIAYNPTWTSTGTQPSLGNGTIVGRTRRATDSDLIIAQGRLTMGSTTTFGTGSYLVSLPVTASADAILQAVGVVYLLDAGTQNKAGVAVPDTSGLKILLIAAAGGDVSPTNPHTWANTDQIRWHIEYEPA